MNYSSLHENKKHGTFDFPIELYNVDCASPRYQMPLHWHLEYELILVKNGSFELSLDGKTFEMSAGNCAWVGSGVVHGGIPQDAFYQCIVFDLESLLNNMPICTKSAAKFITDENKYTRVFLKDSAQAELSKQIFLAMEQENKGYEWTTIGLLWQLIGSFIGNYASVSFISRDRKKIVKLKSVLAYIRDYYENTITLKELADIAGMSPKYFCRAFAQITGKTPIEYLNYYRIEQAGEQLILTENSVTEIALNCGFHDISYFTKSFAKYKGMNPTAFRKQGKR